MYKIKSIDVADTGEYGESIQCSNHIGERAYYATSCSSIEICFDNTDDRLHLLIDKTFDDGETEDDSVWDIRTIEIVDDDTDLHRDDFEDAEYADILAGLMVRLSNIKN